MLTALRKTDLGLQVLVGIAMIASIPFYFIFGFLIGLFFLGIIQLISAAINTQAFIQNGFSIQICNYWKYTALVLSSLFVCVPVDYFFKSDAASVSGFAGVICSVPLALYYMHIYKLLIRNISFKNELGGLIKSKH